MKLKSRKLLGLILGSTLLTTFLILGLIFSPELMTGDVYIWYGGFIVFLILIYIGGNVWKDIMKSKYFRNELHNDKGI